jgi:hypothetical protein
MVRSAGRLLDGITKNKTDLNKQPDREKNLESVGGIGHGQPGKRTFETN